MFLFLCEKKAYDFILIIKTEYENKPICRILHFGRSSKFHCIKKMWNVLNFYSNSAVCHKSTPERDDSNEFHSMEFLRLKVSSTLIPHFFHSRIQ